MNVCCRWRKIVGGSGRKHRETAVGVPEKVVDGRKDLKRRQCNGAQPRHSSSSFVHMSVTARMLHPQLPFFVEAFASEYLTPMNAHAIHFAEVATHDSHETTRPDLSLIRLHRTVCSTELPSMSMLHPWPAPLVLYTCAEARDAHVKRASTEWSGLLGCLGSEPLHAVADPHSFRPPVYDSNLVHGILRGA
jgi:hypothetical protein